MLSKTVTIVSLYYWLLYAFLQGLVVSPLQATHQKPSTWGDYKLQIEEHVKKINEALAKPDKDQAQLRALYQATLLLCEEGLQLKGLPATYEELQEESSQEKIRALGQRQNKPAPRGISQFQLPDQTDGADATYMLMGQLKGFLADPSKDYPAVIAYYKAAAQLLRTHAYTFFLLEDMRLISMPNSIVNMQQPDILLYERLMTAGKIRIPRIALVSMLSLIVALEDFFINECNKDFVMRVMVDFWTKRARALLDKIEQAGNSQLNDQDEQSLDELIYVPMLQEERAQYVQDKEVLSKYYALMIEISHQKASKLNKLGEQTATQTREQNIAYYRKTIFVLEQAQEVYNRLLNLQFSHISEENDEREKAIMNQMNYTTVRNMQAIYEWLLGAYKMLGCELFYENQYDEALRYFQKAQPIMAMLPKHALRVTRVGIRSGQDHYILPGDIETSSQDMQDMLKKTEAKLDAIRANKPNALDEQYEAPNSNIFRNYWWIPLLACGVFCTIGIGYIAYKQQWLTTKTTLAKNTKQRQ